jgi:hypothetical protein
MDNYGYQFGSGLFGSTIDPYAANFGNPLNSANMNPGWGIDPSLLTPSYQAPYRPQVQMPAGYGAYSRPGFGRSAGNVLWGRDPTWGNPVDSVQPSVNSLATKPFDAAAWAGQNIALPFMAYSGAAKILGPMTSPHWSATSIMTGKAAMSTAWADAGLASRMGGRFGMGLARGLGMGAGAAELMGGAGALASSLFVPLLVGKAIAQTTNSLAFDPYLNSRRNANFAQQNFSNVYFGEGNGNTVSGKGLSYSASASIGHQINVLGANDRMFSQSDYSQIFDMSSRAGLYDNVKSSDIVKRTKGIAEQLKLFAAIAKDPDIQKGIEALAQMNISGASVAGGQTSAAASALRNIGSYAAQAGYSVQRMMAGVGAQGQYLFQANGMTPYLGQLAAGNTLAGYAAAQRSGLLSSATLARSGGIEGATQSSLTAQVMGAQTPYAMMSAYNRYILGAGGGSVAGRGQDLVSTISAFGAGVSHDPLQAQGSMALYGRAAAGADMAAHGSLGLENQAVSILKSMNFKPAGANGKFTAEQVAAVMTQHMGLSQDNVRDYLQGRMAETDPEVYSTRLSAIRGNAAEQNRQFVNQNRLGSGVIDTTLRGMSNAWKGVKTNAGNAFVAPITDAVGAAGDYLNEGTDWWNYGRSISDEKAVNIDRMFGDAPAENLGLLDEAKVASASRKNIGFADRFRQLNPIDSTTLGLSSANGIMAEINKAAKAGNADAQTFLSTKTSKQERYSLLNKMARNGQLGKHGAMLNADSGLTGMTSEIAGKNMDTMLNIMSDVGDDRVMTDQKVGDFDQLMSRIDSVSGQKSSTLGASELQQMGSSLRAADMLNEFGGDGQKLLDALKKDKSGRFAGLLTAAGGDTASASSLTAAIDKIRAGAISGDLVGLSAAMFKSGYSQEQLSKMSPAELKKLERSLISKRGNTVYDVAGAGKSALAGERDKSKMDAYQASVLDSDNQLSDVTSKYLSGQLDYSKMKESFDKLDSATSFAMAVDKFATQVDKMVKTPDASKGVAQSVPYNSSKQNSTGFWAK